MIHWLPNDYGRSHSFEIVFLHLSSHQKVFFYWPSGLVFIGVHLPKF